MRLSPLPSVSLKQPCPPGSGLHGTILHLDGRFQPPPYPLPPPLATLSFLWTEVFLVGCGAPTLVFSGLSPSLSLEHCKPIFKKKVPLIPGWAHWWKETDTLSLPLPETSSLESKWELVGTGPQGQRRGALRSGQEAPYQGGNEDHRQSDQQQTGDFPGPNTQPGLGNMRQTSQGGAGDAVLIHSYGDKTEALKAAEQEWVGSREKGFKGVEVSSELREAPSRGW